MFRRPSSGAAGPAKAAVGDAVIFSGMDDPRLLEFIRSGGGSGTASGLTVTPKAAMRNTTVLRCVSLISYSMGMLPLHLIRKDDRSKASDHPLFKVLHRKPNGWQTAFEFRSLMQQRALQHGDAFARIIRTGNRVTQLVPIDPSRVSVEQKPDWTLEYRYSRPNQGPLILRQSDIFHLRGGLAAGYVQAFLGVDPQLADGAALQALQVFFAVEQKATFPERMVHPGAAELLNKHSDTGICYRNSL